MNASSPARMAPACPPSPEGNWVTVDLAAQVGRQVKVQIFDNEAGGCGFVSFDHVYVGAAPQR